MHTQRYFYVYTNMYVYINRLLTLFCILREFFKSYVSSSIDQVYNTQVYTSLAITFCLTLTLVNIMFSINARPYTTFLQVAVTLILLNPFNIKPVDFKQDPRTCQFNITEKTPTSRTPN